MNVVEGSVPRSMFRSALVALVMLGLSAGAVAGTLYGWHLARGSLQVRSACLCTSMVAALVATLFLAMAMRALDRPLMANGLPWYLGATLKVNKRIILVAQLVTMGLALASLFLLAFDYKIPAV